MLAYSLVDNCEFISIYVHINAADSLDNIHERVEVYKDVSVYLNVVELRDGIFEQRYSVVPVSSVESAHAVAVDVDILVTQERCKNYLLFLFIDRNKQLNVCISALTRSGVTQVLADDKYVHNIVVGDRLLPFGEHLLELCLLILFTDRIRL